MTSKNEILDEKYWEDRWYKSEIGWDVGYASPPLAEYINQYPFKEAKILIPGCGNAYEAQYLLSQGFTNITLIDIAKTAVDTLRRKYKNEDNIKVLHEDFFEHSATYDLILEQTFFCAIDPERRVEYVDKSADLLKDKGKIVGVLFNKQFNKPFPPFGGSLNEYKSIFSSKFEIKVMEECYNSIAPRQKSELFINLIKK